MSNLMVNVIDMFCNKLVETMNKNHYENINQDQIMTIRNMIRKEFSKDQDQIDFYIKKFDEDLEYNLYGDISIQRTLDILEEIKEIDYLG